MKIKCKYDGKMITPCERLVEVFGPLQVLENQKTLSRRCLAIAKLGPYKKHGIVLTYCPFCGTEIYREPDSGKMLRKVGGGQ